MSFEAVGRGQGEVVMHVGVVSFRKVQQGIGDLVL